MSHFIVEDVTNEYLYHRRNTGAMYVSRSMWGPDIGQARVFTTKSAATNSANQSIGHYEFEVVPVKLELMK